MSADDSLREIRINPIVPSGSVPGTGNVQGNLSLDLQQTMDIYGYSETGAG